MKGGGIKRKVFITLDLEGIKGKVLIWGGGRLKFK